MVFAVVKNETNPRNDIVQDFYRNFASFIGQPNSVGELTEDVTVMEDLIKDKYRSITSEFIYIQCSMSRRNLKYYNYLLHRQFLYIRFCNFRNNKGFGQHT